MCAIIDPRFLALTFRIATLGRMSIALPYAMRTSPLTVASWSELGSSSAPGVCFGVEK
ncbi:MAG: hypothetical protein ACLPSW_24695 [Roseiarcus sp.]